MTRPLGNYLPSVSVYVSINDNVDRSSHRRGDTCEFLVQGEECPMAKRMRCDAKLFLRQANLLTQAVEAARPLDRKSVV